MLLQRRPANLVRAFGNGARTASGVILQFPFYAGIFGVINGTGLGDWLGALFVQVATTETYPLIVYIYSGIVNVFVPSGGSKWLIEAPYLLPAARDLGVSPTTTLLAYCYGDSTSNLIQPFWAIPILTVTRMKFGDVLGYSGLVAVVLFLVTAVAMLPRAVDAVSPGAEPRHASATPSWRTAGQADRAHRRRPPDRNPGRYAAAAGLKRDDAGWREHDRFAYLPDGLLSDDAQPDPCISWSMTRRPSVTPKRPLTAYAPTGRTARPAGVQRDGAVAGRRPGKAPAQAKSGCGHS